MIETLVGLFAVFGICNLIFWSALVIGMAISRYKKPMWRKKFKVEDWV